MRYSPSENVLGAAALSTMLCAACSGGQDETVDTLGQALEEATFHATLNGDEEVPANGSKARGKALVDTSIAGELSYRLIVANLDDTVAAHIHCAPPGVNGRIGVTLFMGGPTSENGILSEATVTEPDLDNGCLWLTIADVVAAIESGNTYVNAHTTAFPRGEIRGQLIPAD
jgi:hypothetical protein